MRIRLRNGRDTATIRPGTSNNWDYYTKDSGGHSGSTQGQTEGPEAAKSVNGTDASNGLILRPDVTKDTISEFEDRSTETSQTERQRETKMGEKNPRTVGQLQKDMQHLCFKNHKALRGPRMETLCSRTRNSEQKRHFSPNGPSGCRQPRPNSQ